MLTWLGFIACTGLILYSGSRLSRNGDIIAEKTGLGGPGSAFSSWLP